MHLGRMPGVGMHVVRSTLRIHVVSMLPVRQTWSIQAFSMHAVRQVAMQKVCM